MDLMACVVAATALFLVQISAFRFLLSVWVTASLDYFYHTELRVHVNTCKLYGVENLGTTTRDGCWVDFSLGGEMVV
jgi:hypothetical protein